MNILYFNKHHAFWNTHDSIANFTIPFTSRVSLWDRPCYWNKLIYDRDNKWQTLRQYKIRFSLIAGQILAFASHPNMVREVKKYVSKFQANCVTRFHVIEHFHLDCQIHFSLNSKEFYQKLYSNSLNIVDTTCHSL